MKFNKWLWLKAAIGFTRPGCQKKKKPSYVTGCSRSEDGISVLCKTSLLCIDLIINRVV